ncbi:DUF6441 family protein [Salipiger thiooxidans]|uniref:DUF6441 family protein n=1 Tax=Salipiger thiooxidans TaxID=282683 RepID=UPI001CF98E96|nr:DUF6441 family protein [Salipiger thiooxidans]
MSRARLDAALEGNLERFMEDELVVMKDGVTIGVRDTGNELKTLLREDVVSSGLGRRLSRTWRSESYPKSGASLGAASLVFTNAPELVRAFDEGAIIRGSTKRFLAIPTDAAPKLGVGRKKLSPETFPEHVHGKLRFVYRPGKTSLLVVDNQRERKGKRGGYALSKNKRALRTGYGLVTVPMFILVPQVRLRRRLNVGAISRTVSGNMARNIDAAIDMATRRRRRK